MALNFQDLPIPLVEGQDASADGSIIPLPSFLKVTNGEFADRKNIRAVDGLTGLAVTAMMGETAPDDVNPTLRRLLTHKDELLLETYKGTYRQQVGGSFALAAGKNNRKRDALRAMRAGVTSIADAQGSQADDWNQNRRPNAGVLGMDAAQLGDYTCLVWCEQYGTAATNLQVSWQIRHKTSDAIVGRGRIRQNGLDVREPRVVAFGGQFRIFAIGVGGGANIGYLFIDPAQTQNVAETLTAFPAPFTGPWAFFDVALSPSHYCISAAGTGALIEHRTFTQVTPTAATGSYAPAAAAAPVCISNTYVDTGGLGVNQAFVAFYTFTGTETTLRWTAMSPAGLAVGGLGVQAGFAFSILRTSAFKDYSGGKAAVPVLVTTADGTGFVDQYDVQVLLYNATGAAPGTIASGTTLAMVVQEHTQLGLPISMRAGSAYDGTGDQGVWLPVGFDSNVQFLTQVVDIARSLTRAIAGGQEDANFVVLRVFDDGAAQRRFWENNVGRFCSPVIAPDSGGLAAHIWSAKFTPNITNVTDLGQNPTNIQRNTLSYSDKIGSIEFADLTYMAGGCPLVYDGQDVFEEGFSYAPEPRLLTTPAAGAPLAVGDYGIVFVYEWYDGQGNRWQSPVSYPTLFSTTLGNQTYSVTVRSLQTTLKSGVQVIPYRTTAGGTIYRRDSPLGVTPLTDAQLASSEPLYTGGVLSQVGLQSNNALPGVKNFTVHQNRLVGIGGEFERGFFYSKERSLRFPAEFNRASGFGLVPEVTGRVVAGSSIDGKLALFAENGISVVFGQGPNMLWAQNGFTTPERIQAAEGIRFDSPFIAEVDDGVWYVTSLGPRLFTRGLATAKGQSGAPLGDQLRSAGQTLIGACEAVTVHPVKAQVLFRSNTDGLTYIYDYQRDKWTQRDDFGTTVLSMVSARGVLYLIRSTTFANTPLQYENPSSTARNTLTLETGWVSFAGVQRYQRCSHIQVLGSDGPKGDFTTSYLVRLRVLSMEQPGVQVQDTTVTVASSASSNTPWQAEHQMQHQTDTAYKLLITVDPDDSGGNFSITNLLARVGQKRGGAKLSSAQRG